ncbi:hypothetical protein NUW54_g10125 [Trametes sanguinea]|uniref:Uncharacterized protein n=2 Tax=Trametes sanguinea TaxID=158606 RepID=A0ACC1NEF3_9APHY|nr:hypothetical protein NUW54_g11446 [Trametes sanguinea]KAJ2985528.1 hypothetical protein NUW54_g10125 [Trametes sanguinea]
MIQTIPPWLHQAVRDARLRYPGHVFDVVARLVPNPSTGGQVTLFRLVCGDCPGKLYSPGPGDTLSNFEIHLKNVHHRRRVEDRMQPRRSLL